ncbi:MAG: FG-GAP repeat protein [Planctomycetes bacterium]|nr:FG-GAP repeat protein [Planctomycetota bacterium]
MKALSTCVLATLLASGVVHAQGVRLLAGAAIDDSYGKAVANVGDVDGDGLDDLLIGAEDVDDPQLSPPLDVGRVYLLSGADVIQVGTPGHQLTPLAVFQGDFTGDFTGCSVDAAGDVNGDGVPDLLIGARGEDNFAPSLPQRGLNLGAAFVYSGAAPYPLLYRFDFEFRFGRINLGYFATEVAGVGDVNGDGYADIAASTFLGQPNGLSQEGVVVVFSGRDGSDLYILGGGAVVAYFGFAIDGAGDTNRDGYDDFVVSAVGAAGNGVPTTGEVYVYSGFDGSVLHTFAIGQPGVVYGASVAGIGDADGDGHDDVAVGAVFAQGGRGAVYVYSGATGQPIGAPITGFAVRDATGFEVAGGDYDGDGFADVAVGAVLGSAGVPVGGEVAIHSVRNGTLLARLGGTQIASAYGWAIDMSGDYDGDGFPDLLIGAPFEDVGGIANAGQVYLSMNPGNPTYSPRARMRPFGKACPTGNGGLPTITPRGLPVLGQPIELLLRGADPGATWVLNLAAPQPSPVTLEPLLPGCTLYTLLDGYKPTGTTDPVTGFERWISPPIPVGPSLIGQPIVAQFVVQDLPAAGTSPANPIGYVLSNAIRYTFGR